MAANVDVLSNVKTLALLQGASIVFIDFDGVIKDSVEAKSDAFERLFVSYGKDASRRVRQHHEAHGGMSRFEKIPIYLSLVGEAASSTRIQEFCERFSKLVFQAVIDSPWVPGVREYLQANCSSQKFVLLTATPQEEIQRILHALDITHCFAKVYGAPSQKAAAITDTLRLLRLKATDALMIGDSESDLLAAQANGVAFLLRCTSLNQLLRQRYTGPTFNNLVNEQTK